MFFVHENFFQGADGEGRLRHVCQTQVLDFSDTSVCHDRLLCLSDQAQVSVRLNTSACQIEVFCCYPKQDR